MKLTLRLLAVALFLVAFTVPVQAAQFRSEERLTIANSTDKPRDLHLVGENITVDDAVSGDLVIAGGTVLANGEVEDSLFVAGGTVTLRSHVHRHVRVVGGTVTISGQVDGDIFVAGGTVTLTETSQVSGGVYVAGGDVVLSGTVTGELKVGSGTVRVDGPVGATRIYSDNLQLTNRARVNGDLTYFSPQNANIDAGAVITGQTIYKQYDGHKFDRYGFFFGAALTLGFLLRLLGAIILGWVLVRSWPKTVARVAQLAWTKPLTALGYGLLTLFIVSFLGFILAFSVIGLGLAGVMFAVWLLTIMLGSILGKLILGAWIYRAFSKETDYRFDLKTITLGIVVSSLLIFVPLIGPLISAIAFFIGVGAVFNFIIHSRENQSSA